MRLEIMSSHIRYFYVETKNSNASKLTCYGVWKQHKPNTTTTSVSITTANDVTHDILCTIVHRLKLSRFRAVLLRFVIRSILVPRIYSMSSIPHRASDLGRRTASDTTTMPTMSRDAGNSKTCHRFSVTVDYIRNVT